MPSYRTPTHGHPSPVRPLAVPPASSVVAAHAATSPARSPVRGTRRPAALVVAALVTGAVLSGCSAAPRSSGELAGATCTADGRECDVHLVRGGEPTVLREGHRGGAVDMFVVQLSPGNSQAIRFADGRNIRGGSKYRKKPQFNPGFNFSAAYDGVRDDLPIFGTRVDILDHNIDDAHLRVRFPKNWRASRR